MAYKSSSIIRFSYNSALGLGTEHLPRMYKKFSQSPNRKTENLCSLECTEYKCVRLNPRGKTAQSKGKNIHNSRISQNLKLHKNTDLQTLPASSNKKQKCEKSYREVHGIVSRTRSKNGVMQGECRVLVRKLQENKTRVLCPQFLQKHGTVLGMCFCAPPLPALDCSSQPTVSICL